MTVIVFAGEISSSNEKELLADLAAIDPRLTVLVIRSGGAGPDAFADTDGEIARIYGADAGTLYLLRPDLHVAGRWKQIAPEEICHTARTWLGRTAA